MNRKNKITLLAVMALLVITFVVAVQPGSGCFEGCTPGFWKQHVSVPPWPTQLCIADNPANWMFPMSWSKCDVVLDIDPDPDPDPDPWNFLVQDLFNLPLLLDANGDLDLNGDGDPDTLLDALSYQGGPDLAGKAGNLLRQAVASILNSGTMAHKPAYSVISITNYVLNHQCQQDWCAYEYWYNVFTANNEQGGPLCPE